MAVSGEERPLGRGQRSPKLAIRSSTRPMQQTSRVDGRVGAEMSAASGVEGPGFGLGEIVGSVTLGVGRSLARARPTALLRAAGCRREGAGAGNAAPVGWWRTDDVARATGGGTVSFDGGASILRDSEGRDDGRDDVSPWADPSPVLSVPPVGKPLAKGMSPQFAERRRSEPVSGRPVR